MLRPALIAIVLCAAASAFAQNTVSPSPLVAAVLPASRSVQVNGTASVFATMINSGAAAASGCAIAPAGNLPLTFHYGTTDPQLNQITGPLDTPVTIDAGASQSFVIFLTPTAVIAPTNLAFNFACTGLAPAPVVTAVNTLLLSASASQPADVIALASAGAGIVNISGLAANASTGTFAVATINIGISSAITVTANTGAATLPVSLTLCQTDPVSGNCLAPPASSVATTIANNATPTFGIFIAGNGNVPFNPANNRVFVQFTDASGAVRGETSVAVQTQAFAICTGQTYALCATASCYVLNGVAYCECDVEMGSSISVPFNNDGQNICSINAEGASSGYMASTYSLPASVVATSGTPPPGAQALYTCPGSTSDGAYAQCDGGLCYTSTEGQSFPGFAQPLAANEIICSCPMTVASPPAAAGYQIAGPYPCQESFFANCSSQTANTNTGSTVYVGAPTGTAELLTQLLDGSIPPLNQCLPPP
jgi:hypothetical protein